MLHLPRRKTNLRCSNCCPCQAGGAPSAAPATQKDAASKVITRRRTSADYYEGAPSAAPATQNELEMLQVLRLPRRTTRRPKSSLVAGLPLTSMKVLQVLHLPRKNEPEVLQVHTCYAKRAGDAPCKCCACYAKRRGAQSHHSSPDLPMKVLHVPRKNELEVLQGLYTPATQNEPEVLQVLRLPGKTTRRPKSSLVAGLPLTAMKVQVLQVLRLPRKTSRRRSKCCACPAKRPGPQSHHPSPDFR